MKYLPLSLMFFILSINLFSQDQFNRIYGEYGARTARNVVIQNNNYFSVGGNEEAGILGVVTSMFDLNGNFIESKFYADTMVWFHGAENSLQETETGNYILGGQRAISWYRDNLLIKFDNNFDTIFTKTYYPVDDNGYKDVVTYGSCVGKDTSYLLVGTTNIDNNYDSLYQYQMQLIKTDTLGTLLWRKTYGNDTVKHYGYKVVNTFDGGYLLGGWSNINSGDWAIVKVDENGENPIYKYFGSAIYDEGRIMGITTTTDSCYLLTGSKSVNYEFSEYIKKARIIKLDNNLNIIWDKLYLNSGTTSFFFEVLEKNNEKLVSYGAHKNSYNYTIATILELTSQGDSIWRQETTSYDTIQTNDYLSSSKITPDGGMVFGGYTYNSASLSPAQQMWLVKTDSMGCDGTEWTCDISYLENLASKNESGLIIYPNPANNKLHITINNVQLSASVKDSKSPLKKDVKGIDNLQTSKHTTNKQFNNLTIEQFNNLTIEKKLKYSSKNPNNTLWGEKEEQEMRELSHKFAYVFPFEVIKGKVDIFAIDPVVKTKVIARDEARITKQSVDKDNEVFPTKNTNLKNAEHLTKTEVIIYDIFGHCVIASSSEAISTNNNQLTIDVSNLQKGIYIVRIGEYSAKFIKE